MATGSSTGVPVSSGTALSAIEALVIADVAGVEQAVIWQKARIVLREFCHRTRVWRERLSTVTVAGEATYALDALITSGDGMVLSVVHDFSDGAHPLGVIVNGCRVSSREYRLDANRNLVLVTAPGTADWTLTVDVAVLPLPQWESIPDYLVTLWGEAIAAGVVARLLAKVDEGGAHLARVAYLNGISQAKVEVDGERMGVLASRPG